MDLAANQLSSSGRSSKDRIRVAHVALSLELGGAEKLLIEFAKHHDRDTFQLHFIALTGDGVIGDELRTLGCDVTILDGPTGLRPGLVLKLSGILKKFEADVVHTHLDRPHIYGTLAARLARIRPVVHTRHGQAAGLSSRQRRLVRAIARLTDEFVCVSKDAARVTHQSERIPEHCLRVIKNGIDLTKFHGTVTRSNGPIVTVSRLNPEKDLETWLRAARIVANECPDTRFEIVGDGPCRGELERTANELDLSDVVRFRGAVDDVPNVLRDASLFVSSSRTEGISLSLLEAQSHGLPVVATAVGGTVEVIEDNVNGLLVPPGDPRQLAESVLRVRGDESLAKRLGQAGRKRMETEFDVRMMVERYEAVYLSHCRAKQRETA